MTQKFLLGTAISLMLTVSSSPFFSLLELPSINHTSQYAIGQEEANTVADVNFNSPLNNTFNMGNPFLVKYDQNTTNVKPIAKPGLGNFDIIFGGYGVINGTIRYNDNGSGVYLTNSVDGTVYQKGVFEIRPENENSSIKTFYEDISSNNSQSGDRNILLTNGVMFFNGSSYSGVELSSLNNKYAVYKHMIDLNTGNVTTVAWEWK